MTSPPSDDQNKMQEMLARLWEQHKQTMFDRIAILQSTIEQLRGGSLDAGNREQAISAAHKLAGSVGTFGYRHASVLARRCESLMKQEAMSAEEISEFEEHVAQLSKELREPI